MAIPAGFLKDGTRWPSLASIGRSYEETVKVVTHPFAKKSLALLQTLINIRSQIVIASRVPGTGPVSTSTRPGAWTRRRWTGSGYLAMLRFICALPRHPCLAWPKACGSRAPIRHEFMRRSLVPRRLSLGHHTDCVPSGPSSVRAVWHRPAVVIFPQRSNGAVGFTVLQSAGLRRGVRRSRTVGMP